MTNGRAIGTLGAVIVFVGAFLALAFALGIHETWASFLFLLHWGSMEGLKPERLTYSALGAACGIAIAVSATVLAPLIGPEAATAAMLAMVLIATFLLIRGLAGIAINVATMIFLTVATIPHIAAAATPRAMATALVAGIVYFGGLGLVLAAVTRGRSTAEAPGPAA